MQFNITRVEADVHSQNVPGHRTDIPCAFMDLPMSAKTDWLGCASLYCKKHIFQYGGNDFHWQDEPLSSSYQLDLVYNPGGQNPLIPVAHLIKTIHKWMPKTFCVHAKIYGKDEDGQELWIADYRYDPATKILTEHKLDWLRFHRVYDAAKKGKTDFATSLLDWSERYAPDPTREYNLRTFEPFTMGMKTLQAILKPEKGEKHG